MEFRPNLNLHNRKAWFSGFVATLLLILVTISPVLAQVDPQPAQAMWVDPAFTGDLEYCNAFTVDVYVNVTVAGMNPGATGLYAWEFKLYWRNDMLNCTAAVDHLPSSNWNSPNSFVAGAGIEQTFNATHGRYWRAVSALPIQSPYPTPFVGVISICTITFHVLNQPPSTAYTGTLSLSKNYGIDASLGDDTGGPFDFTAYDGQYEILPLGVPSPDLSVQPPKIADSNLVPCKNFTVNVDVGDVVDLYSWEFKLYYRNDILNATNVAEGSFLNSSGSTDFIVKQVTNMFNSTHGLVWVNCTLQAPPPVSGSGTLATIFFHVEALGETPLSLSDTNLSDQTKTPIAHDVAGGYFSNLERIPGDVNNSGRVDIEDVLVVAVAFGSAPEDIPTTPWNDTRNWNPDADLNDDEIVNIFDLVVIGINFGREG